MGRLGEGGDVFEGLGVVVMKEEAERKSIVTASEYLGTCM